VASREHVQPRKSGGRLPSDFHLVGGPADVRTLFACCGLAYACMTGTLALLVPIGPVVNRFNRRYVQA
jgi:hypothetical protein